MKNNIIFFENEFWKIEEELIDGLVLENSRMSGKLVSYKELFLHGLILSTEQKLIYLLKSSPKS